MLSHLKARMWYIVWLFNYTLQAKSMERTLKRESRGRPPNTERNDPDGSKSLSHFKYDVLLLHLKVLPIRPPASTLGLNHVWKLILSCQLIENTNNRTGTHPKSAMIMLILSCDPLSCRIQKQYLLYIRIIKQIPPITNFKRNHIVWVVPRLLARGLHKLAEIKVTWCQIW